MQLHESAQLIELNRVIKNKFNGTKLKALNIGCGNQILESDESVNWQNLDKYERDKIDIIHDLDKYPYPFEDSHFNFIFANMILEHLDSKINPIEELWRITKNNGTLLIIIPYYNAKGALTHIDHKQLFDENTYQIRYDERGHRDLHASQTKVKFKIDHKLICIGRFRKYLPFKKYLNMLLHNIYNEIWLEFTVIK